MTKKQPEASLQTSRIDDFELVRNAEGQWLLVLPDLGNHAQDDFFSSASAELIGDDLFLADENGRAALQSLIAPHYSRAIRTDKPEFIYLCVVDDDGNNRRLSRVPLKL